MLRIRKGLGYSTSRSEYNEYFFNWTARLDCQRAYSMSELFFSHLSSAATQLLGVICRRKQISFFRVHAIISCLFFSISRFLYNFMFIYTVDTNGCNGYR